MLLARQRGTHDEGAARECAAMGREEAIRSMAWPGRRAHIGGMAFVNQVVFGSRCSDCSPQRPYARRSALATFVSATSSVLRDVAMFIRIWPSPPNPYDVPALI